MPLISARAKMAPPAPSSNCPKIEILKHPLSQPPFQLLRTVVWSSIDYFGENSSYVSKENYFSATQRSLFEPVQVNRSENRKQKIRLVTPCQWYMRRRLQYLLNWILRGIQNRSVHCAREYMMYARLIYSPHQSASSSGVTGMLGAHIKGAPSHKRTFVKGAWKSGGTRGRRIE